MTLEILICTLNEGLAGVPRIFLPPRPDVRYLVSAQLTDPALENLAEDSAFRRSDVRLLVHRDRGLARNRNHALQAATGDILLLADDDVAYWPEYFDTLLTYFKENPQTDVACFQANNHDGQPLHPYANKPFDYGRQPRGTRFCSVEVAMRRSERLPRFDERFGLGNDLFGCGEEEVFLLQSHRSGLRVSYYPAVVVQTDGRTTASRFAHDASLQRAKGAVLTLIHGPWGARLRCLKFALCAPRLPHRRAVLRAMWQGVRLVQQPDAELHR